MRVLKRLAEVYYQLFSCILHNLYDDRVIYIDAYLRSLVFEALRALPGNKDVVMTFIDAVME